MIKLTPISKVKNAPELLYQLLQERPPEAWISHRGMPTWEEHVAFINSHPYHVHYIIKNGEDVPVGSVYLTRKHEIGIFIFKEHQHKGYGSQAVSELMTKWPGRFYANIAPGNLASIAFFEQLGAKLIQETYQL